MMTSKTLKKIAPHDLVDMRYLHDNNQACIDLAYACSSNTLFGEQIYGAHAALWLHTDLAQIVEKAAMIANQFHDLKLVLYDGLRPIEAQKKMLLTQRVQNNPQWLQEPRLLSPPGAGAHPRGMAIDVSLETQDGVLLDMGTEFDHLSEQGQDAQNNPAHRNHMKIDAQAKENRDLLTKIMLDAAKQFGVELFPLPQEWWDFRLPDHVYQQYAPLSDADLPGYMQMMDAPLSACGS